MSTRKAGAIMRRDLARPLPPAILRAQQHFGQLWIVDATKLEALFKKMGSL